MPTGNIDYGRAVQQWRYGKGVEAQQAKEAEAALDASFDYVPTGEYTPSLLDIVSDVVEVLTVVFFVVLTIDKFFVRRDYKIKSSEVIFITMMLIRIAIPEINIVLLLVQTPKVFKIVGNWFKNNTNKRAELEAELKLINQI